MSEWQPIETAPESTHEHRVEILLYLNERNTNGLIVIGSAYRTIGGKMRAQSLGFSGDWNFTHWMPLPEPPK